MVEAIIRPCWVDHSLEIPIYHSVHNLWCFLFSHFLKCPWLQLLSVASAFSCTVDKSRSRDNLHVRRPIKLFAFFHWSTHSGRTVHDSDKHVKQLIVPALPKSSEGKFISSSTLTESLLDEQHPQSQARYRGFDNFDDSRFWGFEDSSKPRFIATLHQASSGERRDPRWIFECFHEQASLSGMQGGT